MGTKAAGKAGAQEQKVKKTAAAGKVRVNGKKKIAGKIRKALVRDVKEVHSLINEFAAEQEMLPRSLNELYEHMRDMFVYVEDGRLRGVCSLHVVWEDLAEVRSLAVGLEARGRGIGRRLVEKCLEEARELGVSRVFALTYIPDFFRLFGFEVVDKSELPHKIWGDCIRCPKFPDCNEFAVVKKLK
ncbi:MAG: N-acetyltransferase [Nitrospiraceae bacterium]|nr:N-acetyltransferase [Nitrospiraceae bacterium]